MSKIVEQFLIPLFVIVSVLYAFNSFGSETIALNKVYHHTTENPVHLERANVSFYFSGDPQIQEVKSKQSDTCSACVFFFPHVMINSGECQAMVQKVNDHNNGYRVTIEQVIKPIKGIQLVFNCDHNKFAISYERFDSIGLHKGIVFRLHNKDLLRQLERVNNQPILRTLWHQSKTRIAIDSGHGGIDGGAMGYGGIQEKQVCLAIGQAVGNLLESHGYDVLLTRNGDSTINLDERTAYANNNNADMFVSIHANYAANPRVAGVETFCVQPQLFKQEFSQLSDGENRYVSGCCNQRADYSYKLAQSVQRCVCDAVAHYHDEPIDRKVKFSVSQVLYGAQMPAVLIEVGFVSHKESAELLGSLKYQSSVARGICDGILAAIAS